MAQIILAAVFILSFIGMYLVKDYRNGIHYTGFVGKIQNFINK